MYDVERNIISLMEKGNKRFIELLYDNYADNLFGVVLRIVGEPGLAEDVIQESFIKIWKNHSSYDQNKSRIFTWILSICRNTAIDKLRKVNKVSGQEIQVADSVVYDNRTSEYNPDVMDIRKHLDKLDEKYVSVINALFFQGLTQQEASEKLEIPLGTVKTRLKIGLRELKKIYFIIALIGLIYFVL